MYEFLSGNMQVSSKTAKIWFLRAVLTEKHSSYCHLVLVYLHRIRFSSPRGVYSGIMAVRPGSGGRSNNVVAIRLYWTGRRTRARYPLFT